MYLKDCLPATAYIQVSPDKSCYSDIFMHTYTGIFLNAVCMVFFSPAPWPT